MFLQCYGSKKHGVELLCVAPQCKETPDLPGFFPMGRRPKLPEENHRFNDSVREELCELIQKNALKTECPGKIESMLEKACPGCGREINALVSAFRNGISGDLIWNPSEEPRHVLFKRLVKRLQDNEGLLPLVARWAVESWVLALSFVKWTREQKVIFGGIYSSTDLFPSQKNLAKTPQSWIFLIFLQELWSRLSGEVKCLKP